MIVTFLGINLDTVAMESRLPEDKLQDLGDTIRQIRRAKKEQLPQI